MLVIVTSKFNSTGARLAKKLASLGVDTRHIKHYQGKRIRCTEDDVVLNWGCLEVSAPGARIWNEKPVGKLIQLRRFNQAEVPIPEWSEHPTAGWGRILARESRQFGGRGIVLCETLEAQRQQEALGKDLFVEYIPKIFEVRAHVAFGKLLGVSKKIPANPADIAWNNHTGGHQDTFRNKTMDIFTSNLATDACKAVGYDFGAVDIIYDKHGRPYVLEVNTAPALVSSEDRIMAWAEAFKEAYDA